MPIRFVLRSLLLTLLPLAAAAQAPDGQLTGTLDCPARSLFESGSTPVRGAIRGGEIVVNLPELVVSGAVLPLNLGVVTVQIAGQNARHNASFTGVLTQAGTLHARGLVDERPCNLNLTLSAAAPRPTPTPTPTQQAATPRGAVTGSFEGPWAGTVNCPTRSLFDQGEMQVRGEVRDNVLTLLFADMRVRGVIIGVSPTPLLRLEGGGARGGGASFDGLVVTPQRIHARGLVNEQPCNVNITPVRAVPGPPVQAQPVQPTPDKQPTPTVVAPNPPVAPREPEPRPPVASTRPTPPPTPAPQRPSAQSAADQLACALAGTCPQPAR